MPGGDRTGPLGAGPMTGRAAGFCAGYALPGYAHGLQGRGYGRGFGRGIGCGFRRGRGGRWGVRYDGYEFDYGVPFAVPYGGEPTRQQEKDALKGQAKYFEEALAEIKKRISDLEEEQPHN